MTTGIYPNLSIRDYHASDGISKSGLDLISRSPRHYWHDKQHGERKETPALVFGSLVHTLTLDESRYKAEYAVEPFGVNKRTNAGKAEYDAWLTEEAAGRTVVTVDQVREAKDIAYAVRQHPMAGRLLTSGQAETSLYWADSVTDVLCKCRPDWLREDGIIVDLKTCADASAEAFMRASWSYRYHVQAAFYSDGVRAATGMAVQKFIIIAVEKEPPYCLACYIMDAEQMAHGLRAYRRDLDTYAECLKADSWPAYPEGLQYLTTPPWADK